MSYDLHFQARARKAAPAPGDFTAYFKRRKNYKVSDAQSIYENESSGVYFSFGFEETEPDDDAPPGLLPLSFNLNYFRPHIFGLEAAAEIQQLVGHFDLLVSDYQIDGMGDGEFSLAGFLSGWNQGNEFAYKAFLKQGKAAAPFVLPTARIEACWRWNLGREALQEQYGDDIFVPRIMFLEQAGKAVSTIVWPDGIPVAMPETETILIPRKSILPKRWFRSVEDMALIRSQDIGEVLHSFPVEPASSPYRLLNYRSAPAAVVNYLRGLPPLASKVNGISVDKILNAELVEKYSQPQNGENA